MQIDMIQVASNISSLLPNVKNEPVIEMACAKQKNGSDCGIFAIENIAALLKVCIISRSRIVLGNKLSLRVESDLLKTSAVAMEFWTRPIGGDSGEI